MNDEPELEQTEPTQEQQAEDARIMKMAEYFDPYGETSQ